MKCNWNEEMCTSLFKAFVEPSQPYNHNYDVDETKIADHGNHIDVDLLVRFQHFYINTMLPSVLPFTKNRATNVFSPDSVEALAPKKNASTAWRLP
jgi:hypothetical protein